MVRAVLRSSVHPALLDALAVLFPVDCAGCGAPDRSVCDACAAALAEPMITSTTPGGLRVRSAVRYEGTARHLLLALKEDNRTDVATTLARTLAPLLDPALSLVAIPPSPAAWSRRGYDPVRLLVRGRSLRALEVTRQTNVQKSLTEAERAHNRAGSLRARGSLAGLRLAIVDDIMTTGATLDEAARAIRAAGGEPIEAVTLAATPRYFERSH
jgi:predicted amidophosphoribosyltransferase